MDEAPGKSGISALRRLPEKKCRIAPDFRSKAISVRLLEDDIIRLKAMALHEGMPYQTYISHLIHYSRRWCS